MSDVATIREALARGARDEELLDGREFEAKFWRSAVAALDSLVARERDLEAERDEADRMVESAWRQRDDETEKAKTAEARAQQLEDALRDLLDNLGGHDHWREGGAGGSCPTCVRQSKAASRTRAALETQ